MEIKDGLEADFFGVDNNYFKLDGCVFEAVEDPDDGYRSCMEEVRMKDSSAGLIFFQTPLALVRVTEEVNGLGHRYNDFAGYALVDVMDGHVWLIFGTDEADDHYPSFTFDYFPKSTDATV